MAQADIPVDLFNPGQVFACLGFLEAAEVLLGDAEGGFDWRDGAATRFTLRAAGDADPVAAVLAFLADAEIRAVAPAGSRQTTENSKVQIVALDDGAPFPFPDPPSPATLPAVLTVEGRSAIVIDHWGDATQRDTVKFWGGSSGYSGAARARDCLDLVKVRAVAANHAPFALSAPQTSSFRFDWRRDYIPLEVGFSPNKHGKRVTMVGFPLVEILAAIGLSNARPDRIDKLQYRYGVVQSADAGGLLPPMLLRAALGGAKLPFPHRIFWMQLGWPAQENQERCIVNVVEEPQA
ncbi:MAG: type I-U CRISPR-associated protein Cas8c [Rhodospirillaceae bacterium]|nr:type I-U CRISPR-associated protein Cas8c [Rhodospirillaceae bacterium]